MIACTFLDTRAATIRALEIYEDMTCILAMAPPKIKKINEDMVGVCSSWNAGSIKNTRNLNHNENRIINAISEKDVLQERYNKAAEYMDWFKPCWDALKEEEQLILSEFFQINGKKEGAVDRLCDRLFCSKSEVYRRKDNALNRLTLMLYGF